MVPLFYVLASFCFSSLTPSLFAISSAPDTSFLNTPNLFEACEISFIQQTFTGNNESSLVNTYLDTIRQNNLYTPLTIQEKFVKSEKYNFTHYKEQLYNLAGKSGRVKVTFMNFIISVKNGDQDFPPPNYQLLSAARQTNPDYVFISAKFPPLEEYYLRYAADSSSPAILVFSNILNHTEIVIPCIVCISHTLISLNQISSLFGLATLWETTNTKNLQAGIMLTSLSSKNPDANCEFCLSLFKVTDNTFDCTLKLLSKRYNFTLFSTRGVSTDDINRMKSIIGKTEFQYVLDENLLAIIESEQLIIYDVELVAIEFAIVTQFWHAENSIWGFFTPFEGAVWLSILASCIGISIILQFEGKGLPNDFSGFRSVKDFIMVQSLLFGQAIADEVIKSVKNKQVARPVLGIWFFVCYIVMENLYQGTIYSEMTVMYPPYVPTAPAELVASNMTIITTSNIFIVSNTSKVPMKNSLLKTSITPEVLKKNFSPDFKTFVKKLDLKMEYIQDGTEDISMIKNMSGSLNIRSNQTSKWISTKGTFAIMDMIQDLELYMDSLRILGKRLVIKSNPDASFHFFVVAYGRRNFISPNVQAFLRRLAEIGIFARFNFLTKANSKLQFVKKLGKEIYSRFVAKLNSNFNGATAMLHSNKNENEDKEAVGALWYVLALCSLVVSVATVIFVWELVSGFAKMRKLKKKSTQVQLSNVRMVSTRIVEIVS
ncbi:hypothetical protein Fcan01_15893 [Folsomia candida]|uniref:Uncharacterized protein n=1 Tax=Folsomia candida TaxID=158441 RepID=A0A226DXD7_FOLCA|nr:hypothetical protein Fcan01_15893 [Folsomia candida]